MSKEFDINEITEEVEKLNEILAENKVPHIIAIDKSDNKYCLAAAGSAVNMARFICAIIDKITFESNMSNSELIELVEAGLGLKEKAESENLIEDFKKQAAALSKKNLEDNLTSEEFRKNIETQIEIAKAISALVTLPKVETMLPVLAAMAEALDDDDEEKNDDK